jgi:hypothetical protein
MQGVPERIIARRLVHFYKADKDYGSGVAAKLGMDMERFVPWADLSLAELIEKTFEENYSAPELAQAYTVLRKYLNLAVHFFLTKLTWKFSGLRKKQ